MKMQWIQCDKTFDRTLFEEIGKLPEGKKTAYILLRCQMIEDGKPNDKVLVKLLSIELINSNVTARIDGSRYFEFFNRLYINDYLVVED